MPSKPAYGLDGASIEHIMELRGKALPFPEHLCDTAYAKHRTDFNHSTNRDRDGGTSTLRPGDDWLEEFATHAHGSR